MPNGSGLGGTNHRDTSSPLETSSASNLPLDVFDTHFLPCLLVVIVPLALVEINIRKSRRGLSPDSGPNSLMLGQNRGRGKIELHGYTSALNSVNSRPRQSMRMTSCRLGGDSCTYFAGAFTMLALDSLCSDDEPLRHQS